MLATPLRQRTAQKLHKIHRVQSRSYWFKKKVQPETASVIEQDIIEETVAVEQELKGIQPVNRVEATMQPETEFESKNEPEIFQNTSIKPETGLESKIEPKINLYKPAVRDVLHRKTPLLLLPHHVKKAYHVHLQPTSTIPGVVDKYSWLTKTVLTNKLPNDYHGEPPTGEAYEKLLEQFHDVLQHKVAYTHTAKKNIRHTPHRLDYNLVWDILRLTTSGGADHLRPENSFLYQQPDVETSWMRGTHSHDSSRRGVNRFYQAKFQPEFVLRTRSGLPPVESIEDGKYREDCPDAPYNTHSIPTFRRPIVHFSNKPAMRNFMQNPFQHTHTSIIATLRLQYDYQFLTTALLTTFAQLSAQARAQGLLLGTELEKPLVSQCVVTDGHRLMFCVYQLNSLLLNDDDGAWNRAWCSPLMPMFENTERQKKHYMLFEGADKGERLQGFDPKCFELLVQFMRMKPLIQ